MNKIKRFNNQSKKKGVGFFESLKDLGGGIADSAVNDLLKGTAEEAVNQLSGQGGKKAPAGGVLEPERPFDLKKYIQEREEKIREEERRFFERKRAHERVLFSAEEQRTLIKIEAIQKELRKLVNETEGLSREVKTAAVQVIVEPGIYHLSFLEKLLELIKLIRKKILDSKTWLVEWNSYCKKKRNFYWAQVQKSGTKFLLSSERYMSTQAG